MINMSRLSKMNPAISVIVLLTADAITGDGAFESTDLMEIPMVGDLILTATGDSVDHKIYVPQMNHKDFMYNNIPVLNSGLIPDFLKFPAYKIPVNHSGYGDSPNIYVDLTTGSAVCLQGLFFPWDKNGKPSIVAQNTPDILVYKVFTATTTNALENTELEDPPGPGIVLTWTMSNVADTEIQVRQRVGSPGNFSYAPDDTAGLSVDLSKYGCIKEVLSRNQKPYVTVTQSSDVVSVASAYFRKG